MTSAGTRPRSETSYPLALAHSRIALVWAEEEVFEAVLRAALTPLPVTRWGSIGSVGDALDNAMMESTNGLYKTELIDFEPKRCWRDAQEVETETASWVYWYNHQRLHSSIGDVPPIEYEQDYEEFNTTRKAQ